jgi:cysteine desulfurase
MMELPRWAALATTRDALASRLLDIDPGAVVFGADAPRLPNTLSISMPGVSSETQIMALDLARIAVSAGSACSSGKVRPSHVLAAMGVPADLSRSAIRISLGPDNTEDDVDRLIAAWRALRERTWHRA